MKYKLAILVTLLFLLSHCSPLPMKKLSQSGIKMVDYEVKNDSLKISLNNGLACPLRISVSSTDESIEKKVSAYFPIMLSAAQDTILFFTTTKSKEEIPLRFSAMFGNPKDSIYKEEITLPFKKDQSYKIIQGYNGGYSHTSEYSKYALDFNLQEGDTVCAAADGYVVGVIEGYTEGGKSKKWRDYANFITLFHPSMNIYTQYVHLMYDGSFVEVGDQVAAGQEIGRSGKTGYTDMEHLHFNVLIANDSGMQSEPMHFVGGYPGADLKKGDLVRR